MNSNTHPTTPDQLIEFAGDEPEESKPLSEQRIIEIRKATGDIRNTEPWADTIDFARAIERAHGIKD